MKWADEHLVVIVPHNELGHDPIEETGYDGKIVRRCPLYPGIECRDHVDASVDVDGARGEGLVKVPFIELCPNTWLVPPVGEPLRIPEEDQFVAAKVRKHVEALQETLGPVLSEKAYGDIRNALGQADAAIDEEAWTKALRALAGIAAHAPKPHAALRALVDARREAVDEPVGWVFEDLEEDDDAPVAERAKAVRALLEAVDVEVYGAGLPVAARMRTWLEAHGT